MSKVGPIIELHPWLALPSGQALLDWEQAQVDRLVADVFGFHALQLGLPELDGLRCNRMPHKWLALDSRYAAWQPPADRAPLIHEPLVLPEGSSAPSLSLGQSEALDLSIIKPYSETLEYWLRGALVGMARSSDFGRALDYAPDGGHPAHREAGAQWLRHSLPEAHWQQVVMTAGAQHGLMVAISALSNAGDLLLCESLTYPGIISVAHGLERRLRGVAMDEQGMIPEALREQCLREKPALLVLAVMAVCQWRGTTLRTATPSRSGAFTCCLKPAR